MMGSSFDFRQLNEFERDLLRLSNEIMPRENKKFLNKEGGKLRTKTRQKAKPIKKHTGNYHKGIKKGKVYIWRGNGGLAIRVYAAPHGNLLEKGHRIIQNGKEIGFTRGFDVFEDAKNEFENTYFSDVETHIDEMLRRGLG